MSTTKVLLGAPVTQSTAAVVSLLKYIGKPFEPLPVAVELTAMVLVLSNKRDAYYVVNDADCSCPSAAYRPGQRCKHQRRFFPQAEKSESRGSEDSIRPTGKWLGGFNGPVEPEVA